MTLSESPEDAPGETAVSLLDRLTPPWKAVGTGTPRTTVYRPLPVALVARASETTGCGTPGIDTACLGGWLVLLQQWLGGEPDGVGVADSSPGAAGSPGFIAPLRCPLPAAPDARGWLQELDEQGRHAASNAAPDSHAPARFTSVWLRPFDAAALAALPAGLPLALGLTTAPTPMLAASFDTSLTTEAEVQLLLQAALQAAEALLDRPDEPAHLASTLTSPQQQALAWFSQGMVAPALPETAPSAATPAATTVHARFAAQAARRGDAIALSWRGQQLSYAELARQADAMADLLRSTGIVAGDTVAVALERAPRAIVAVLALLKLGAAYLPLDPGYPAERLRFMLDDADAQWVITTENHRAAFAAARPLLCIDDWPRAGLAAAPGRLASTAAPSDGHTAAYVMYTSGSTGTPKGIVISHRAILRLVVDAAYVDLSEERVLLHAAPLGFDASTFEIWGALLNGGRCVLYPDDLPTGPGLRQAIRDEAVDTAWLTAALFNAVVDDDPLHLHGLRQLLTGGEALSVPHVRRALAALPGVQLINGYGPTECTTFTATHRIPRLLPEDLRSIPIGRPITATSTHVLGPTLRPLPPGLVGELFVGGAGVARGYLHRPELTAQKFLPDPFGAPGETLYRTGDLVRWLPDGTLEFVGRNDAQIKVRGFRIELGDIEAALASHPAVRAAAVAALKNSTGDTRLVAYAVAAAAGTAEAAAPLSTQALRQHLAGILPEFMLPASIVWLPALPLTANGKLDRRALPSPDARRPDTGPPYQAPTTPAETLLCEVFAQVLGLDRVGRLDNFFELGGNSLGVLRVLAQLARHGGDAPARLSTTDFFRHPSAQGLARALEGGTAQRATSQRVPTRRHAPHGGADAGLREPIALIALAGRFPGATDVEQLWANLCEGRESITHFEPAELDPSLPAELTADPAYVPARGVIDGVGLFDAAFFGISPKEAALMDPQQRIFLELCWECLERGGHAPGESGGPVGVFAGMYNASYYQRHLAGRSELIEPVGEFAVMLANEKDYIATRVAHKLNLTGPAVSLNTACSTSLVAIVQAMGSLRLGQCDMALAGGASVTCPPRSGYLYQEGAMLSPDGRTRSFDGAAQGTVFSDGAGVVLLKRLSDALADGDPIYAVLRGGAINNDGGDKASFTAPSVDGQAAVIEAALRDAEVDARSISYVEAHGTATPMGDPVEIEALTQAYRGHTADSGFCKIGSIKSNLGHTVVAAGAAGVIKTALSLAEQQLPASLHFTGVDTRIAFDQTPFSVNPQLIPWPRGEQPRRAGVSSFGVGGTNAHVVLEEAPLRQASEPAAGPQLLQLSARTPAALQAAAEQLAAHLAADGALNLADVAHTLRVGRTGFAQRLCVVAETAAEAVERLRASESPWKAAHAIGPRTPDIVFMFPGQGSHYAGMGSDLYASEPVFRAAVDECLQALGDSAGPALRDAMFGDDPEAMKATAVAQPALFVLGYALAQTWRALGVQPRALIGHSVGEFVAATLAGVFSAADAVRLVARRGALMQALPPGAMLSVGLPAEAVAARLPPGVAIAAHNAPSSCVVSGPAGAVAAFRTELDAQGTMTRPLQTSHAFHSPMMDPVVKAFEAELRASGVTLRAPALPIVSTLTGELLQPGEATDPGYWARHLRETVRFSPAMRELQRGFPGAVLLEVGPRQTLATLARQHRLKDHPAPVALASLADAPEKEAAALRLAAGRLWALGAAPQTGRFERRLQARRLRLPTYPFERKLHWVEARATPVAEIKIADAAPLPPVSGSVFPPAVPLPEPSMTVFTAQALGARKPQYVKRLGSLVEDLAGVELDAGTSFVEQGLDSLQLTQFALQVKRAFKVNISFRQLMESLRTLDALAQHLDEQVPADAAATAPPAAALSAAAAAPGLPAPASTLPAGAAPVFANAAGEAGVPLPFMQQVIQQQMVLMAQQLAMLSGNAPMAAAMAIPPAAVVAAPSAPFAPPEPAASELAGAPTPLTSASPNPAAKGMISYDVKTAFGAIARIHTSGTEPVTERQQMRLDAFMRRYIARSPKSKAYTQQHRPHLADPRVVNGFRPALKEITYQLVIERSKGSRVWDIDGNEYIDVLNGFGMNMFGWSPDFVQHAVRKQLDLGYEIGPQHPLAGEVAQQICEMTGFDRAGLCNTGSEAVMGALRIARTITGRNLVVIFTGSYHGIFDEVIVRGTKSLRSVPAAPGILANTSENVLVLDYGSDEALRIIQERMDDIAAVLVEPVQSRRPDLQPREFLQQLREITHAGGALFIFDEVVTGFRIHPRGARGHFGVEADLATYGKVVGGGFPIGVIAGRREFMDALDGGHWEFGDDSIPTVGVTYFAGTFVRHPLALAAAHAVLTHLKAAGPSLQQGLTQTTTGMVQQLNEFCGEVGAPITVKHFGSVWKTFFDEDHPLQDLLFAMMRSRGIHVLDNFPCFMTTAHSEADVQAVVAAFKESVLELQEADFLPRRKPTRATVLDASAPPVAGARLGKDPDGKSAWYVPHPDNPKKFLKVGA